MRNNQHLVGDEPSLRKEARGDNGDEREQFLRHRSFPQTLWDRRQDRHSHLRISIFDQPATTVRRSVRRGFRALDQT